MNQAEYQAHQAAIEAGEAAQAALADRLRVIINTATAYRESRIAEWNVAFPEWARWRKGPSQSIFDMGGFYASHIIGGNQIQLTYRKEYTNGDSNEWTAFFPLSLMWATDEELTTYLKGEFETTVKRELERRAGALAVEAAQRRAQYEALKGEFGT